MIRQLNAAVAGAVRRKDLQNRFHGIGLEAISSTPKTLAALHRADLKVYGELISRTGIAAE